MADPWRHQTRPDLHDRIVMITGASGGVGAATAQAFAEAGAHVLLAVRNPEKARGVVIGIADAVPGASLEVVRMDLADLGSVREAADAVGSRHSRLDVLINNAAVAAVRRATTVDGFETQIGVAHFGHFALTGHLLPLLLATPGGRVVTVTSGVAVRPRVDLADLQFEQGYRRYRAYTRAKSANMLFALELHRRLVAAGAGVRSLSAQPGWTTSGLGPGDSAGWLERRVIATSNALMAHSPEVGAQPLLMAALSDVPGGTFVTRRHLNGTKGTPEPVAPDRIRVEPGQQEGLWAASERLTGVIYDLAPGAPGTQRSQEQQA